MNMEVLADADSVAQRGAAIIAEDARAVVGARGRFVMAERYRASFYDGPHKFDREMLADFPGVICKRNWPSLAKLLNLPDTAL